MQNTNTDISKVMTEIRVGYGFVREGQARTLLAAGYGALPCLVRCYEGRFMTNLERVVTGLDAELVSRGWALRDVSVPADGLFAWETVGYPRAHTSVAARNGGSR